MYAIIELAGRQWNVQPGTRLEVNRVGAEVGAQHVVDQVLLAADGERLAIGRPYVAGAKVVLEVQEHRLGPKVISYHFRRRENWRKTVGHRQRLTRLVVKEILLNGGQAPAPEAVASEPKRAATRKKRTPAPRPKRSTAA